MEPKDGGPAFPDTNAEVGFNEDGLNWDRGHVGMSLRDYFAAHALQGMQGWFGDTPIIGEVAAHMAYEIADAMLKERAK